MRRMVNENEKGACPHAPQMVSRGTTENHLLRVRDVFSGGMRLRKHPAWDVEYLDSRRKTGMGREKRPDLAWALQADGVLGEPPLRPFPVRVGLARVEDEVRTHRCYEHADAVEVVQGLRSRVNRAEDLNARLLEREFFVGG